MGRSYHTFHETVKNLRPLSLLRTEVLFAEPWEFKRGSNEIRCLGDSTSSLGGEFEFKRRRLWVRVPTFLLEAVL
jgi:hypothetical protein